MVSPESGFDVVVAGGGPAGLSAGLALAEAGLRVAIVDPLADPRRDRRTSALMVASVTMLRRLGVWDDCEADAAPLERMRIIDDTGRLLRAPTVEFSANEVGEPAFGWNIHNRVLVAALRRRIADVPSASLIVSTVAGVELEEHQPVVVLADGRRVGVSLIVAADGRRSLCREAAGIAVDEWRYDQSALVTDLEHARAHHGISTEFHGPSGPFTLVPLPGDRSSLVWVDKPRIVEMLAAMPPEDLAGEIERRSHRLLGKVRVISPRSVYRLSGLNARRYAADRVALVGEAAHVIPPIGAQGLNLGLRDAAMIAEIAGEAFAAGQDVGGRSVCAAYDSARRVDIVSRAGAVDLLNRTLLSDLLPLQALRAAGLGALSGIGPIRRALLREGIAPVYALPRIMRPVAGEPGSFPFAAVE